MHFKNLCMLNFNKERNSGLTRQKPLNQFNTFIHKCSGSSKLLRTTQYTSLTVDMIFKQICIAMEKERGISITSSIMQFDYNNHVINLLDTPGHEDFSEDTYRTLTAVDSALMVIPINCFTICFYIPHLRESYY